MICFEEVGIIPDFIFCLNQFSIIFIFALMIKDFFLIFSISHDNAIAESRVDSDCPNDYIVVSTY